MMCSISNAMEVDLYCSEVAHRVTPALEQLRDDLDSGAWEARYGHLLELESLDCGYRLVRTI